MSRFFIGFVAAGLVMLPFAAGAADNANGDVETQLRTMQQRMSQMEDRLQATTDQLQDANQRLDAQTDLIHRAKIDQDSQSGVAAFLDTLEIGGWIAGSWNYNFHSPSGKAAAGFNSGTVGLYPFHPDANAFSLDQLWFALSRPTSEENRAGFHVDLLIGKTGDILNGVNDGRSGTQNGFHLYQAYIEYLAPVGPNGVTFQAGKMATWIGAEVAPTVDNFNITRGMVYTLFEPITNVGIRAETELGSGVTFGAGFVNGTRSDADREFANNAKAVVWKLAWQGDTLGAQFAGTFGKSSDRFAPGLIPGVTGPNDTTLHGNNHETILDLIFRWDPNEKFSSYVNLDYLDSENNVRMFGDRTRGYGGAVAGRYAVNERMGIALRGEWVDLDNQVLNNFRMFGITGTADYALTDHLKVRGEVRYDNGASNNRRVGGVNTFAKPFCSTNKGCAPTNPPVAPYQSKDGSSSQVTTGVEVIYSF